MSIKDMTTKCSIEVEVFDYDQLPDKVKKKLFEQEFESLGEIWQCDHVLDFFKEKLEGIGFMEPKLWYSGFGSQGDGACFDARVDLEKVFKHLSIEYDVEENDYDCAIVIVSNHYVHENTRRMFFSSSKSAEENDDVEEKLEDLRWNLCKELYKALEEDYDGQTSEESCLEGLRSRGYALYRPIADALAEEAQYEVVEIV